ncbi:MAG: ABC transporter permease [Acidobacteriota bacterium]|nr:ABC transporter permease [Acidobacteriota bacterium]
MSAGDRVYRALLLAFPRDVRAEAGELMTAELREKRRAAAGRPFALALVWLAAAHDALWHGLLHRAGVGTSLTTSSWSDSMRSFFETAASFFSRDAIADLRLALRRLAKTPAFTAVALLTMALGIGATSAIFSVVHAVLLTPLPFPDADRLVGVYQTSDGTREVFTPPNFLDMRSRSTTLASAGAFTTSGVTLTNAGDPARLINVEVSDGFFDTLATAPLIGRPLQKGDNEPGRTDVVVLGHAIWQSRFGGRPDIVGRPVTIEGRETTVVGVMPRGFAWPEDGDIYMPALYDEAYRSTNRGAWYLDVVGRLAPGASLEASKAELATIAAQLQSEYPVNKDVGMTTHPLLDATVGSRRTALLVLLGAVGVVLLIACANVANLMLARAAVREGEFAVRAALGAGRARLIRQLLIESLVLAVIGGLFGLALAYGGTRALVALGPAGFPRLETIGLSLPVVLFTFALALVTGIVFGLVPALQASRTSFGSSLRERGKSALSGVRGRRTRAALVVAELALAVVLLVGAGLLLRSFARLVNVDPGFDPSNGITFTLGLPEAVYDTDPKRVAFHARLREELNALPGVAGSAIALSVPPTSMHFTLSFKVAGRPPAAPGESPTLEVRLADSNYFRLMGIPVTRGRGFEEGDRAGATPVVVITESAARRHFADEDPIGREIELGWRRVESGGRVGGRVVGVVADVKSHGLDEDVPPQIYVPAAQVPQNSTAVVLRTHSAPEPLLPSVRAALARVDPGLPIIRLETLEEHVSRSVSERRFYMLLVAAFAAVALALAAIGIFGVLSYLVSQRTREIGIRVALGASRRSVIVMVLRQAMVSATLGVALGLVAAIGLSRFLTAMLFELKATDPVTFAAVAAMLLGVAFVAAWLPARRAVRVDPTVALRVE